MVMSSGVHPKEIRSRSHHIATLDLQTNFGDLAPTSKCNIIYNFSSVFFHFVILPSPVHVKSV
jgi:hypothetical protein